MLSLTVTVFISAIVLLFAQEFTLFTRKLIDIPGVKLLVPLLIASCLTEMLDDLIHGFLLYSQVLLSNLIQNVSSVLPFETGAMNLVSIILLYFLACIPLMAFWIDNRRRGLYKLPAISYYLSALLWSLAAFLLIVQPK